MKKLLLLAAAALTVVACKKDSDDPTPPPAPPAAASPYVVNIDYPKTIVIDRGAGNTETVTHTVDARKLLTKVTWVNGTTSETVNFDYDNALYLSKVTVLNNLGAQTFELSYNDKKQVERIIDTQLGDVVTQTFTYNNNGKIATIVKDGQGTVRSTTYQYEGNVVKENTSFAHGGSFSNTYTLDTNGNVVKTVAYGYIQTATYTTGKNYNAHPAFRWVAEEPISVGARQVNYYYEKFFAYTTQKNFPKTSPLVREYQYNNEQKPTQIVLKSIDNRTQTFTLTY